MSHVVWKEWTLISNIPCNYINIPLKIYVWIHSTVSVRCRYMSQSFLHVDVYNLNYVYNLRGTTGDMFVELETSLLKLRKSLNQKLVSNHCWVGLVKFTQFSGGSTKGRHWFRSRQRRIIRSKDISLFRMHSKLRVSWTFHPDRFQNSNAGM